MNTQLVKYDAMCRAITAAYRVDEVKEIRNKAKAIEEYSRQAKNIEAERQACEIRLRAERKAGDLRRKEEKSRGGRPSENLPPSRGKVSTNSERRKQLGISKKQDEQWQRLAAIPDAEFERALASPEKPTTNGIIAATTPKAKEPGPSDKALWLWGRLCDFERNGTLASNPNQLLREMTKPMRTDTLRLAPLVAAWLERIDK